ncbi:hypothetical protein mRhiFer1_009176 [Rhinolophus ferrumequinum]|uniref:Uncharacterized protein n=1 Tax=Rhinolophus ferrumequinum TaxID=59479 RepID=A0A7J7SJI6_RHIFE|nr:hypothetical protein mRhiFer1_009176 [Rhinolophus ferrumequinum]
MDMHPRHPHCHGNPDSPKNGPGLLEFTLLALNLRGLQSSRKNTEVHESFTLLKLPQRVWSAPETSCWSQSEEDYIVHTCDSTFLLRRHFWGLEQTHHQLYQAVQEPVGPSGGIRLPSVMSCFGSLLKA